MSEYGLSPDVLATMRGIFAQYPGLSEVILYGSRAKGTFRPESDIDLALVGVDAPLEAASIADALDELPLPYRFDVQPLSAVRHPPLREHIARMGRAIYHRAPTPADATQH